jgi:hypothetical protein
LPKRFYLNACHRLAIYREMSELNIGVALWVEHCTGLARPIPGLLAAAEAERAGRIDGIAAVHRQSGNSGVLANTCYVRKRSARHTVNVRHEALLAAFRVRRYREHVPFIIRDADGAEHFRWGVVRPETAPGRSDPVQPTGC